jgi:hypothetical protein
MPPDDQIPVKRHRLEHAEIFEISADELDSIERSGASVGTDLQFATFLLPIAITLTTVLLITPIQNSRLWDGFFITLIVGYVLGSYFLIKWGRQRNTFKEVLRKIRDRRVGPLGQEGRELLPRELAELPAQEAGPLQLPMEAAVGEPDHAP